MKPIICRLPNHVGDCCMTLASLRLLKDSGFEPILVGKGWGKDLLAGTGFKFATISGKVLKDYKIIRDLSSRFLDQNRFGMLFPNSFSSALSFFLGGINSCGFATDARGVLLTNKIQEPPITHEVLRFFKLTRETILALGGTPAFDSCPNSLDLPLLEEHRIAANNILKEHSIKNDFALLAPVAKGLINGKSKEWPYFNELAIYLKNHDITPIVLATPEELVASRKACPEAEFLPPVNLGVYASLCKKAKVVVANDSGISHVAASVGANQITLIGVTEISRTRPWSPKAVVLGENGRWPTPQEVINHLPLLNSQQG